MANELALLSEIDERFQIKVFGKKVTDIAIGATQGSVLTAGKASKLVFVKVFEYNMGGECKKVPVPFYTLLPDTGVPAASCSTPEGYLMWVLGKEQEFVSMSITSGKCEEILSPPQVRLSVDSDFHFHDFQVSGNTVSATLRAYLRLRQPGPFGDIFNIVVVDGDFKFSVDLDTCVTAFSIGVASAEVCFRSNPNRICGAITIGIDLPVIGHWGKTFDVACVNI